MFIVSSDINLKFTCTANNNRRAREAKRRGIKIVSIVDTNVNPDIVDYPIPANDDAIMAVSYIIEKVKETIINSKPATVK